MRALLETHAPQLIAKAVEMALSGDATALRLCVDRIVPAMKAKDEPIQLPAFTGDAAEDGKTVLKELAEGRLGPDDANAVMSALAAQVRIVEVVEIERRLSALEAAQK